MYVLARMEFHVKGKMIGFPSLLSSYECGCSILPQNVDQITKNIKEHQKIKVYLMMIPMKSNSKDCF